MEIETEAPEHQPQHTNQERPKLSGALKKALLVLSSLILSLGALGGPILLRLYYVHGGSRAWLSSFLETAGFPILLVPLVVSYFRRLRTAIEHQKVKLFTMNTRLFVICFVLGVITGGDDFLYGYGVTYIPVSTSSLLISTQLAFTALFAFILVRQKFTPFSINAVVLLSVGAVVLGFHSSSDRPPGVSKGQYLLGFLLTLSAAAVAGLLLPLIELSYMKAKQKITYTLVMEVQFVISFVATLFCAVGMIVKKDFQAIPREAKEFDLGETKYYLVLVWSAIFWELYFLGAVGVIYCASSLLTGIIVALLIPAVQVCGVIFFKEKFTSEKGVSLALCLWGFVSYYYGEILKGSKKNESMDSSDISGET